MNVGVNKIEDVIKTVLNYLTNVKIDGPFPSLGLTSKLFAESKLFKIFKLDVLFW